MCLVSRDGILTSVAGRGCCFIWLVLFILIFFTLVVNGFKRGLVIVLSKLFFEKLED